MITSVGDQVIKKLSLKQQLEALNDWFVTDTIGRDVATATGRMVLNEVNKSPHGLSQSWVSIGIDVAPFGLSDVFPLVQVFPYAVKTSSETVQCDLRELPLVSNGFNNGLLFFLLDWLPQPQMLLQEVSRVLKPQGNAYVCVLNPWTLWRFNRPFKILSDHRGRCVGLSAVKRWLKETALDITGVIPFHYAPPYTPSRVSNTFFEQLGRLIMPYPANFLLIKTTKVVTAPVMQASPQLSESDFLAGTLDM